MIPTIFKSDWFDGRSNEFITSDDSKKIGWDEGLTNYSEFLFNETYLERLVKDKDLIIEELNNILEAMDVTAGVGFSNKAGTAYTDGERIAIDNKFVPMKKGLGTYSKFDILIGLLIHEACHCKYTDFDYCKSRKGSWNTIIHSIHNVLEDECIERNIGLNFPGYSNFIKAVKLELFKRQMTKKTLEWGTDDLQDIFNLLLITVRYPEKLKIVPENVLEQHAELFEKIKEVLKFRGILDRKENLDCTRDTVAAAIAIFNLLDIDETEQFPSSSKSGEGSGSGMPQESSEGNGENGSEGAESQKGKGKPTLDDAMGSLGKSLMDPTDNENIDSSSETIDARQEYNINKELTYDNTEGTGRFGWGGGYGVNENIKDWKKSNVVMYNKFYGDVKNFIKDFQKIIVPTGSDDQFKKVEYQRTGQLDPNQIVSAIQGGRFVNTKLQKTVIKNKPKYALVLNIDESSSMFGDFTGRNIRIHKSSPYGIANRLAVLFYEAMKDYKDLQIYIYGHGDNINRYIFPGKSTDKYILGNRQLQGGQDDARSINKILTEVREHTQLPIIMVNITDSLYLSGIDDMSKVAKEFGDVAITLMCVSQISKKYMTPEHIKTNDSMYGVGNWVTIDDKTDLRKIAIQLAKVFKSKFKTRDKK